MTGGEKLGLAIAGLGIVGSIVAAAVGASQKRGDAPARDLGANGLDAFTVGFAPSGSGGGGLAMPQRRVRLGAKGCDCDG